MDTCIMNICTMDTCIMDTFITSSFLYCLPKFMTAETWSFWQPMSLIKSLQDTQFSLLQVRKTIIFLSWQVLVIVDSCLFITEFSSLVISLQHLDYRLAADWRFIDTKLATTSKVTTKQKTTQVVVIARTIKQLSSAFLRPRQCDLQTKMLVSVFFMD